MKEFIFRLLSLWGHLRWLCPLLGSSSQVGSLPLNFDNHSLPSPADGRMAFALLTTLSVVVPLYINFLGSL